MTDPASLKVSVSFTGLDNDEAAAVLNNLPVGTAATIVVTAPTIGKLCKRYAIEGKGLSLKGAKDLTTAAFLFSEGRFADKPVAGNEAP
jgi:hypothetical protein